jgi:large subunit ribosomal protein L29
VVGVAVKIKEIRDLSDNELQTKLNDSYQEMFNLRFQLATRQLANFQRLGEVRKTIAQIKTIMRERKLVARL